RRRPMANRNLMTPTLDPLQHFERTVGLSAELVNTLKLVENLKPLSDQLHGGSSASRSRFPAAEYEQARAIEVRDTLDSFRQQCGRRVRIGKAAGARIHRNEFKAHSLGNRHHHLLEFCSWSHAHQPDLAACGLGCQVGGFIQSMSRPGIQYGGQHHFVLERGARWGLDRFQSLQRVGHDAAADYYMISVCHSSPVELVTHILSPVSVVGRKSLVVSRWS